jgi:LysM repeat protein
MKLLIMKCTANRWEMIKRHRRLMLMILIIVTSMILSSCIKQDTGTAFFKVSGPVIADEAAAQFEDKNPDSDQDLAIPSTLPTPTPNAPIVLPTQRFETLTYTVVSGDTLRKIAQEYQVSINELAKVNDISNPNLIEVGQVLRVPPPMYDKVSPSFKIIPDSELANSPSNAGFDTAEFINNFGGYLKDYSEDIDGISYSGTAIIERVAVEYSVNPRLLLALLEYQSQWVTKAEPDEVTLSYPMRNYDIWREGLYRQLGWAADLLNEGYYLWKINAISVWFLSDGSVVQVNPTINPGTAGVLNFLRYYLTSDEWESAVSEQGFYATYLNFFGYPFSSPVEPMVPEDLQQPLMQLPFEEGISWSFTGGPHGGWGSGSGWAALDFAPPGDDFGCYTSDAWVTASAPGLIVYSDHGAVIQDLDGDGVWQTGWSILYMHIDNEDRVEVGTILESGDRIGHPSCEGGFSSGTHLHIARRYNGEWVSADADQPMILDGWVSSGTGVEYDGYLTKDGFMLEAWDGRSPLNAIER